MKKIVFCLAIVCLIFGNVNAQQVFKTTSTSVIGYLEYLPQDYNSNSDKYPVVIFLHGIGERGANSTDPAVLATTINTVAKLGPPMYVKNGTQFPFILISPQLKNNYGTWPSSYVMEVINHVKTYLRIDEKRIYITGLSLGGGGTWVTVQDYPELFAATAPVCGGYNSPSKACGIASENLPVWAFHGDKDTVVPMSRTINMVNAINGCIPTPNPLAKVTIYAGIAHNAWDKAYKTDHSVHNPNVYEWLLSYSNTKNKGNSIPVANAGVDLTKSLASSIVLTGTGTDVDGTIASYEWKQISGASLTLTNSLTSSVSLSNLKIGTYIFRLKVTDNSGNTDSDYLKLTVTEFNALPVVNAGSDVTLTLPSNSTTIAGTASDTDGTITAYKWSKVSGPSVTMLNTTTKNLTASSMVNGTYTFRLTATDDDGATKYDDVLVTVNPDPNNILPIVSAGADKSITLPVNAIVLTGSASDTDGSIKSYKWTKVSGKAVTMTGTTTSTLSVSVMPEGTYVFRLTVTDNSFGVSYDDVTVKVLPTTSSTTTPPPTSGNVLPVANAGADRTIYLPSTSVSISGNGTDSDGTITSYKWSKVIGGNVGMSAITSKTFTASSLLEGTYTFRLTVTDDKGGIHYDDMNLYVKQDPNNVLPTVNAGADKTVTLPVSSVALTGTATDTDGTIASYIWTKISGKALTMGGTSTATLTLSSLAAGSYTFRLTVTDNKGSSKYDDVILNVLSSTSTTSLSTSEVTVFDENPSLLADRISSTDQLLSSSTSIRNVVVFNESGKQVYAGAWNEESKNEVFNRSGLYIYHIVNEDNTVTKGKLFIRN